MELSFPEEDRVKEELRNELGEYFDYARRLLRFWLEADKDKAIAKSTLAPVVLRVLLAMTVKTSRQFRSVVELCERGEAVDGSIIARSMFESVLVIGFVLKRTFIPRRFDGSGKETSRIEHPGVSLTRELRAMLFLTHHVLQPGREAAKHAGRPGMKRFARRLAKLIAKDRVAEPYEQAIGPDWTATLKKKPHTYSGLSISDLSRSLGKPFARWYDIVYGRQSEHVHPADLLHHMQMDDEGTTRPQWHESVRHVRGTLETAVTMFYMTISRLNQHVRFGVAMDSALHGFAEEYHRLIEAGE